MKIAVIGATGFLGSNIIKHFSKKIQIVATYKNKIPKKFIKTKNVKWKFLDIYEKKNFYKYLGSPDIVIHLAWSNLPNYGLKFHLNKELPKQKKFIHNLVSGGLKNIFIAGTCFEYGNQNGKLDETMMEKPNNNFALAKCKLKNYTFSLIKKFNFNLIWGRIFYIYGKHNSRNTLYNQILESSKKNREEINVSGGLIRDYLHMDDISKIIVRLSLNKKNHGLVNICSGRGTSLKTLIKNICKKENIKSNVRFIKKKINKYEPNQFWGCNKKLIKCLKTNN